MEPIAHKFFLADHTACGNKIWIYVHTTHEKHLDVGSVQLNDT